MKKFDTYNLVFILGNYWKVENYSLDEQEVLYRPTLYGRDHFYDSDCDYYLDDPCSARGICNHWSRI